MTLNGLSHQSRAVLLELGGHPGVTPEHLENLQTALRSSPELVLNFNASVAAGQLRHVRPLPQGSNAGGTYDGRAKTISLPLALLSAPVGSPFDPAEAVFVLGHELQHGQNHAQMTVAYSTFLHATNEIARGRGRVHDYTTSVADLIGANRYDESAAQIAGWNAIVSQVTAGSALPTLQEIYLTHPQRMKDFIEESADNPPTYRMRRGLRRNNDGFMDLSTGNLEAMGRNYFDKDATFTRLGHNGTSDYANYYGAYAASVIGRAELAQSRRHRGDAPQVVLDLERLGLSEDLMEQNGIDLGGAGKRQAYFVPGHLAAAPRHFDHTAQSHAHVPIHAHVPGVDSQARDANTRGGGGSPDTPAPLDPHEQRLHRQIAEHVTRLDAAHGRDGDGTSARLVASLLVLAREHSMVSVDHVVLSIGGQGAGRDAVTNGERVFLVQGQMGDPAHLRAGMSTQAAIDAPVEESMRRLETVREAVDRHLGGHGQIRTAVAPAQEQEREPAQRGIGL